MNFKVNLFFFQLLDPLHPLDKKFACTTDPPPLFGRCPKFGSFLMASLNVSHRFRIYGQNIRRPLGIPTTSLPFKGDTKPVKYVLYCRIKDERLENCKRST